MNMTDTFTLQTPQFQGPLEKLLDLIEARKMSISDVSLSEVTDAYLAYVEKLPQLPLGETAQFILIASTLLLIKSRSLLPTLELTQDERASVEELERRLAQYALVRQAAKQLRAQWGTSPLVLMKRAPLRPVIFSPAEITMVTITTAIKSVIALLPASERIASTAVAPVLALEDVIKQLHRRISSAIQTRFSELTKTAKDRHEVIVYFLAILELVRSGSASVTQEKLFDDITVQVEQVALPRYGA
jgi:segregation and condensation protein A